MLEELCGGILAIILLVAFFLFICYVFGSDSSDHNESTNDFLKMFFFFSLFK